MVEPIDRAAIPRVVACTATVTERPSSAAVANVSCPRSVVAGTALPPTSCFALQQRGAPTPARSLQQSLWRVRAIEHEAATLAHGDATLARTTTALSSKAGS